ncbi:histidine kinase [Nonomuraea sp. NPDC050556]|uniref:DUF7134 domain-containing protein n=1 Tax=Nonomuraea sp. NPDC050556 TaxID=3364369 RepID=UPI003787ECCD
MKRTGWDAVLAAGVLVAGLGLNGQVYPGPSPLYLHVALALPLVWRRRAPVAVLCAISVVAFAQWVADVQLVTDVALLVALYTVAARTTWRRTLLAAAVVEVGVVLASLRWALPTGSLVNSLVFLTAMVVAAVATGTNMRLRRAHLARLKDERDQRAMLAVAGERARIAREMHDIVTHNLSVMVALADAAVIAQPRAPDRATAAMTQIAETGRQALTDMHHTLGALRTPDAPPPSTTHISAASRSATHISTASPPATHSQATSPRDTPDLRPKVVSPLDPSDQREAPHALDLLSTPPHAGPGRPRAGLAMSQEDPARPQASPPRSHARPAMPHARPASSHESPPTPHAGSPVPHVAFATECDAPAERHPLPGLAELDALVAQMDAAGLPTSLDVTGNPDHTTAGLQLTIYRLTQEALTNTLKHAPPGSRATVAIHCAPETVTVQITDHPTSGHHASRHGILGMRERAAAYGGTLEAGPLPGHGWRVAATLHPEAVR